MKNIEEIKQRLKLGLKQSLFSKQELDLISALAVQEGADKLSDLEQNLVLLSKGKYTLFNNQEPVVQIDIANGLLNKINKLENFNE